MGIIFAQNHFDHGVEIKELRKVSFSCRNGSRGIFMFLFYLCTGNNGAICNVCAASTSLSSSHRLDSFFFFVRVVVCVVVCPFCFSPFFLFYCYPHIYIMPPSSCYNSIGKHTQTCKQTLFLLLPSTSKCNPSFSLSSISPSLSQQWT